MPKIDLGPYIKSIIIALIFFAIGRFLVIEMGNTGILLIIGGLVVFYLVWWIFYRRGKKKSEK